MQLLIQFVAVPIIAGIPIVICLLMCWILSSWRRWLAIVLALMSAAVLMFEIYSASVGGNLTGLIWFLSLPILAIAFIVLYIMEKLAKHYGRSENSP